MFSVSRCSVFAVSVEYGFGLVVSEVAEYALGVCYLPGRLLHFEMGVQSMRNAATALC